MKYWMDYVKASYEIILYGEGKAGINLDHEVEAFVVHTFARYMENPNIPSNAIAIQLMTSLNEVGEIRKQKLQKVIEECILIDGLELNCKKWPTQNYFIDMGMLASEYRAYSQRPPELFYETISNNFVNISKVLHKIKDTV